MTKIGDSFKYVKADPYFDSIGFTLNNFYVAVEHKDMLGQSYVCLKTETGKYYHVDNGMSSYTNSFNYCFTAIAVQGVSLSLPQHLTFDPSTMQIPNAGWFDNINKKLCDHKYETYKGFRIEADKYCIHCKDKKPIDFNDQVNVKF